jgi:ABC-2 type transport system permease protein
MDQLQQQLEARELDGILRIHRTSPTAATWDIELIVRQSPPWLAEIQQALNQEKTNRALAQSTLTPEQWQQILGPQPLQVTTTRASSVSLADQIVAGAMGGLMVVVCFMGLSFFMVGITGEKQQRITEQIVSAISPQTWIDGKLIGLTCASFASMASLVVGATTLYLVAWLAGYGWELPDALSRWDLFPLISALFIGGAIFWNCFFAAVSSIINDPNTSAKSGLLFLPMMPIAAGFIAIPQPDGLAMRVLSMMPGTSATAMPIRLLLGNVAYWEIGVCLLLLFGGIFVLRLAAGRIFEAGIMLYGKEPTWFEVLRWAIRR